MKPDKINQLNSAENDQLKKEIAPVEILFGAAFISIIFVLIVAVLMFI